MITEKEEIRILKVIYMNNEYLAQVFPKTWIHHPSFNFQDHELENRETD